MSKTVLLTILDGWGAGGNCGKNALESAKTPTFDEVWSNNPHTKIHASGEYVGLPDGQMGNSEVGHLNLGAGRIVYQELTRINKSIREKDFFNNERFLNAVNHAKEFDSALHLMGLVSDGGVHSSMEHLFALIELAAQNNLKKVYVHAFLDGRDTPPQSAIKYVKQVDEKLAELGLPKVATVSGRYYAMDRDKRWDRVEKAYNCLTIGEGNNAETAEKAIEESYDKGTNDEFVLPTLTGVNDSRISDNDSVIFFNFRPDRAREITRAINDKNFDGFERTKTLKNIYYVCMTQYDETFGLPIAFPPQKLTSILGDVLDKNGLKQFRTAETEKYAHVTFFFNGGVEKAYDSETRVLVDSPKVATYDLQPEMSANQVADKVVEAIHSNKYDFILVNFANPDMVGHTGIFEAAVSAVETIDNCLKRLVDAANKENVVMLITADHGNVECMSDPKTGAPFTAHTTNDVPFIVLNYKKDLKLKEDGMLADVAPTILDILEIEKPEEMTGVSLISK